MLGRTVYTLLPLLCSLLHSVSFSLESLPNSPVARGPVLVLTVNLVEGLHK